MVTVDDGGKPTTVAPLRHFTPDECRRHAAAALRKTVLREIEPRFGVVR